MHSEESAPEHQVQIQGENGLLLVYVYLKSVWDWKWNLW